MSMDKHFSDEHLNAFVDGELDGPESKRVVEAFSRDAELSAKINELRKLKDSVQQAYSLPVYAAQTARHIRSKWIPIGLAASLLIGAFGGWFLQYTWPTLIGVSATKEQGTVIQVSDNDPKKWKLALMNAKNIRNIYGAENMAVEIVASGPGLEMLKRDSSVIPSLEEAANSGIKLIACGNTMKMTNTRLEELIPYVEVVKHGVVEIVQKQQRGYSYVKP